MNKLIITAVTALALIGAMATSAQAVNFWTGGVGIESRAEAPLYNTAIQFFQRDGSFLADIHYVLFDGSGQRLLEGRTEGPWLFVNLPNGDYSIRGHHIGSGETQSIRFSVDGSDQLLGLRYQQ